MSLTENQTTLYIHIYFTSILIIKRTSDSRKQNNNLLILFVHPLTKTDQHSLPGSKKSQSTNAKRIWLLHYICFLNIFLARFCACVCALSLFLSQFVLHLHTHLHTHTTHTHHCIMSYRKLSLRTYPKCREESQFAPSLFSLSVLISVSLLLLRSLLTFSLYAVASV